jgi:hypothetical protein
MEKYMDIIRTLINFHYNILGIEIPVFMIVFGLFIVYLAFFIFKQVRFFVFHLASKTITLDPAEGTDPSHRIMIAKGANLSSQNGIYLDSLRTGAPRQVVYKYLFKDWNLSSKKDIVETLNRLISEPFSEEFDILAKIKLEKPSNLWEKYFLDNFKGEKDQEESADSLKDFYSLIMLAEERMSKDGITDGMIRCVDAYNLERAINISRWAYQLGFLSEAESWVFIGKASEKIKLKYDSYRSLSAGYILGRIISSGEIDGFYETQLDCHDRLLSDPLSSWVTIPW